MSTVEPLPALSRRQRVALAAQMGEYMRRHRKVEHTDASLALRFDVPLSEIYRIRHARE